MSKDLDCPLLFLDCPLLFPRPLRGIFRKRRHLLDLLLRTAIDCLRDWFSALRLLKTPPPEIN